MNNVRSITRTLLACGVLVVGCTGPAGQDGAAGTNGANGTNGTNGGTGATGATGPQGDAGPRGPSARDIFDVRTEAVTSLQGAVTSVDISSGKPVVSFWVRDSLGRGAVSLGGGSAGNVRFSVAKLTPPSPDSGDSSAWQSYVNGTVGDAGLKGTQDRTGTLLDNGDGSYVYTFAADVTTGTGSLVYDATLTHRLAIQVSGRPPSSTLTLPALNIVYDFVPAGTPDAGMYTREIVDTDSCNQCHGRLLGHGSRYEMQLCVTCHNPGTVALTKDGGVTSVDMKVLIHTIHRGAALPSTVAGGRYTIGATHDYSGVLFPQDLKNCRKCHNGEATATNKTSEGNNWRKVPTREACGSCHDNVDFGNHPVAGTVQANNKNCVVCHTEAAIELQHTTNFVTPNNPLVPVDQIDGGPLVTFRYELLGVTSLPTNDGGGDYPVVDFRIYENNEPITLTGTGLPAGISSGPTFLIASTAGGASAGADYTNPGGVSAGAGQPLSVALADLRAGTAGTVTSIVGSDGGTAYRATFSGANKWPQGAAMRAIAVQGTFSQTISYKNPAGTTASTPFTRETPSVVMGLTGDAARRVVVDNAKCLKCHEILRLHTGRRVNNTGVCVVCHNTSLSSPGRTADAALFLSLADAGTSTTLPDGGVNTAAVTAKNAYAFLEHEGYDPNNPIAWPETSLNLKDLVHGIHTEAFRRTGFVFTRTSSTAGATYEDYRKVKYPQAPGNCLACHLAGTYAVTAVPSNALPSSWVVAPGLSQTKTSVQDARKTVPNDADLVRSPMVAACAICHDSALATQHMTQNGGLVDVARLGNTPAETCAICHAAGRLADVETVHPNR